MKHPRPINHLTSAVFHGSPATLTAQQLSETLACGNPFHERVLHQGRSYRVVAEPTGGGKYRVRTYAA